MRFDNMKDNLVSQDSEKYKIKMEELEKDFDGRIVIYLIMKILIQ